MNGLVLPQPVAIVDAATATARARAAAVASSPPNSFQGRPLTRNLQKTPASDLLSEADLLGKIDTVDEMQRSPHLSPAGRAALAKRRDQLKTELELVQTRQRLEKSSLSQTPPITSPLSKFANRQTSDPSPNASRTQALGMEESIRLQEMDVSRNKEEGYAAMMASLHLHNGPEPSRAGNSNSQTSNSTNLNDALEDAKRAAMAGFLWHKDSDSEDEDDDFEFDFDFDEKDRGEMEHDQDAELG